MAKRARSDYMERDRVAHVPQVAAVGLAAIALAGYSSPAEMCLLPCANPGGADQAVLPPEFGFEPLPTQISYTPVVNVAVASGGTVVPRG